MPMLWPNAARAACAFTFDLDAETLWMARGVTEPVTLSQGRFGPIEAMPRILQLLKVHAVRASFFIPAWVAEQYPDTVRAIAGEGHEIGCHGDVHERVSDLPAEREEEILLKSVDVLTKLSGRRPVGYRAPAWQFSDEHAGAARASRVRLLVEHDGPPHAVSASADRRPRRWWRSPCRGCWTTRRSSCSRASARIQPPGPVLQSWITEFDGITEVAGATTFTFHPQIIGRPSRFACLRELIDPRAPHAAHLDRHARRDQRALAPRPRAAGPKK